MMNTEAGDHTVISQALAKNLKDYRERQGLSLSELAKKANIGKSTLSVLETGNGNPNIETVWALAIALKVPFGQLIDTSGAEIRLIKKGEGISVDTKDKSMIAGLLTSRTGRGAFELYQVDLSQKAKRKAEAHKKGTFEHIYVIKGKLITGPVESTLTLQAGDLASFPADTPHVYEAFSSEVIALVLMDYS